VQTVRIVHPEAGEAQVPPSAVKHWESSGWTPADETPQVDQAKDATPSRRRTPKESE
jgi:hypothetical protein